MTTVMRLLPVAAAAVAVSLLLPSTAVAAAPATTTKSYAASSAIFANPGRGFFTYTETRLGTGQHVPLVAADLGAARRTEARSVVCRIFYLDGYAGVDRISVTDLAAVRADFAAARAAGVKLVVRFAYTSDSDEDAPVGRVVGHIAQLAPVLTAGADVLVAVQAGFVGRWGEWYYSRNFPRDAVDRADRKRVLTALLAATSPSTVVQVRTPQIKRSTYPAVARVGVHNDCFLAGTDDYGTYTAPDDAAWLAQQATMLVGGETCDVSARSGWPNAGREMAAYHWTYLNPSFHAGVLDSWGAAGRAEASRRLGYRVRLVRAVLPRQAKPGAKVTARITLVNDGYAAPVQNRPVRLVLRDGARVQSVGIGADVRTWAPGRTVTLTATFAAPKRAGAYRLALDLPDPSARLAADPAYAIRLANDGVWEAARGSNALGATLTTR